MRSCVLRDLSLFALFSLMPGERTDDAAVMTGNREYLRNKVMRSSRSKSVRAVFFSDVRAAFFWDLRSEI